MKKILIIIIMLIVNGCLNTESPKNNDEEISDITPDTTLGTTPDTIISESSDSSEDLLASYKITMDSVFRSYFENETSSIQVLASGVVKIILDDDLDGDAHQKFILELQSGQTLLVTHNIDLAPRVDDISVGAAIYVYGEYIWNSEGGLVHWTHKDPDGEHEDGWIVFDGVKYW